MIIQSVLIDPENEIIPLGDSPTRGTYLYGGPATYSFCENMLLQVMKKSTFFISRGQAHFIRGMEETQRFKHLENFIYVHTNSTSVNSYTSFAVWLEITEVFILPLVIDLIQQSVPVLSQSDDVLLKHLHFALLFNPPAALVIAHPLVHQQVRILFFLLLIALGTQSRLPKRGIPREHSPRPVHPAEYIFEGDPVSIRHDVVQNRVQSGR